MKGYRLKQDCSQNSSDVKAGARPTGEVRIVASSTNWIEGTAIQQLKKTSELPGMRLAVGLPDLHPGKGSPVGAAFAVEGWIYPALIGNDIGCGIGLWRSGLNTKKSKPEAWADLLRDLDDAWSGDAREWLRVHSVEPTGYESCLGTIGGGNHFAELQIVEKVHSPDICRRLGIVPDAVYLSVHSGSRGFGEAILRDCLAAFGSSGLAVGTPEASHYLVRHEQATQWAVANRELIAARIFQCLRTNGTKVVDVCHNWVEPCDFAGHPCWLHRKGAAPSTKDAVIIPGSRGAFSYLVSPKEPCEKSAYSLAHGAGRKWSRTDCRARLERRYSSKDLTRTDLGSYVVCENKELLYEEAPQAYKNIAVVIDDMVQAGLVEVAATFRPLVTYKVRR
jgi:release factor H-coupled RctB family protein